jgi:hypothetical protein
MSSSEISILEASMPESRCVRCGKRIRKGHPRFVLRFMEFGLGPGHPAFSPEALEEDRIQNERHDGEDRQLGLLSATVLPFCGPCSGEDSTIPNLWHAEREERAADDPGGSVWAKPVSQVRIGLSSEIDEDYKFSGPRDKGLPSPNRTEGEDRYLSGNLNKVEARSKPRGRSLFTEDDRRHRMARFLMTPDSRQLKTKMREVCELWSTGMKQPEIATKTGISQATVCRSIQAGDAMALNYSRQSGKN